MSTSGTINNANRSSSSSSSNPIINPSQLQSQFQSLHTLKTNLTHQIRTTDNLRSTEEQTLLHLHASYRSLEEKYRIANSNAGNDSKKRTMMKDEIKRLQLVMSDEAKLLMDLSGNVDKVERERRERKERFVDCLEECNDEMGDALRRFEESGSDFDGWFLRDEGCCRLLIQSLEQRVQNEENEEHETENGQQQQQQQWNAMLETMRTSIERFNGANDTLQQLKKQHSEITQKSSTLRQAVHKQNREALGDAELDELERLWEQQQPQPQMHSHDGLHDVDTGRACTNDEGEIMDVDVMDGNHRNELEQHQHEQQQQQQHTNMHLFYGEDLHSNEPAASPHDYDSSTQQHHRTSSSMVH